MTTSAKPHGPKRAHQYNPSQWTIEIHFGEIVFPRGFAAEAECKAVLGALIRRMHLGARINAAQVIDRLRLWHHSSLQGSWSPSVPNPRMVPEPDADGITRLAPVSRKIQPPAAKRPSQPFQFYNSPEYYDL